MMPLPETSQLQFDALHGVAARKEDIVETEAERFHQTIESDDVAATIVSLQVRIEIVRQDEIRRVRGRLGKLSPEQENAIEALTRSIVNKIVGTPMTVLKAISSEEESIVLVEMVHRIFNLGGKGERERPH
jgi:glutamyl-tRNA reductase